MLFRISFLLKIINDFKYDNLFIVIQVTDNIANLIMQKYLLSFYE
jgi:hypothetical protein